MSADTSSGKTRKKVGQYYGKGANRYKFLGYDEKGQEMSQGAPVKKTKMRKVKPKGKTNYKSTGSRKGKAAKKPLIDRY